MKKSLLALAIVLVPSLAWAQGAVLQNGPVIKFDLPGWVQDKTIMSGGKMFTDNFRGFNPSHFFDNHGPGVCTEDALTSGAYHQICIGHDSNGNATITVTNNNGAAPSSLLFSVNGTVVPVPGTISGKAVIATNAILQATPTTFAASVERTDFSVGFGAPATTYTPSSNPCSLNGGNGDDGSQVKSSDNKCWLARFDGPADITVWGADKNGAGDSTAAVNAAFAAGVPLFCGPGTYKVSAISVLLDNASLTGSGSSCNFQASGTTGNIFTIGSGAGPLYGTNLSRFKVTSAAPRTTGAAILGRVLFNANLVDLQLDGGNLWNGVEFAQFGSVRVSGVRIDHCLNDGIRAYGGPIGAVQLYLEPSTLIGYCAHDGIVIGGGVGGLQADASVFSAGRYGIYFTTALAVGGPAINREIFMGPMFEVDTSGVAGMFVDTGSIALFVSNGGWYSSTQSGGPGVEIQDGNLGVFSFQGSQFFMNSNSGLINNQHSGGTLMCNGCRVTNNGSVGGGDGFTLNTGGSAQNTIITNSFINSNGTVANGIGIRFVGSSGNVQVMNNYVIGNAQAPIIPPTTGNYVANSRIENNSGYNPVFIGPITVGASPFTHTAGLSPETVYIGGGTLSALNINLQSTGTGTNMSYHLEPGDSLAIAYSVAPTMIVATH